MWKQALGVEVTLTAEEFKSLLQDVDRGEVEMFRSSWSGDYNVGSKLRYSGWRSVHANGDGK